MSKWCTFSATDILQHFSINPYKGLTEQCVREKRQECGYNELPEHKSVSIGELFLAQCTDLLVIILLIATGISWYLGETLDAVAILAIVLLNAFLGMVQEYRAEKALSALKQMSAPQAKVIRSGRLMVIPAREVVPGDILLLEAGDRVVADARLFECNELEVDESILTGESFPVAKHIAALGKEVPIGEEKNMVFSGTAVTRGNGKAVVVSTGRNTEVGRIAEMIAGVEERETPLQKRLKQLGKVLLAACLLVCALVGLAGILRGESWRIMFLTSVSLAVAAIPEGLPAVVTIALAVGVQKMAKRNAIIRKLPAVETLGSTTVICSDKTGTLTENKMRVEKIYLDGREHSVLPEGKITSFRDQPGDGAATARQATIYMILETCFLNNKAIIVPKKQHGFLAKKKTEYEVTGDPTETALVNLVLAQGWRPEDRERYRILREFLFTSERKRMTVIYERDKNLIAAVKGAPEVILQRCSLIYWHGRVIPLEPRMRHEILLKQSMFGKSALRVLAFAFRNLDDVFPDRRILKEVKEDEVETNLVFLGIAGMMDPPRAQVPPAISRAMQAGIDIKMITGDYAETAMAIAQLIGLPVNKNQLIIGQELEKLPEDKWPQIVNRCSVFARVSPAHKLRIVRTLKDLGEVVAMTGDGVNDAPAVKEADIGVAMGLTGTEVTKEASSMVVADDNFATIVNAVEEGRIIYENIRKFIRYLLGCNIGEVLVMFLATIFALPVPLLPIQLLFVNLVTDGLPAIALGVDTNNDDMMKKPPRPPAEGIFARGLGPKILVQGTLIGIVSLLAYIVGVYALHGSLETGRTMAFGTLVFAQLCYVFQCRAETKTLSEIGIFGNTYLVGGVMVSVLMQLGVMTIPFFMKIFHTVPLTPVHWTVMVILAGASLIWSEGLRTMKRMVTKGWVRGNG